MLRWTVFVGLVLLKIRIMGDVNSWIGISVGGSAMPKLPRNPAMWEKPKVVPKVVPALLIDARAISLSTSSPMPII